QGGWGGWVGGVRTNGGAEACGRVQPGMGFGGAAADEGGTDAALGQARKTLPPELWNRIDERLVFQPLRAEDLRAIARMLLDDSSRRLASERGIAFAAGPGVAEHL